MIEGTADNGDSRFSIAAAWLLLAAVPVAIASGVAAAAALNGDLELDPKWLAPLFVIAGVAFLRADRGASPLSRDLTLTDQLAVVLLCGSMFTMTWNGVRFGGVFAISDLFLMTATIAAVPSMFRDDPGRIALPPLWVIVPAGVLTSVGLISVIFLGDVAGSLIGMLRLVAAMVLVPFAVGVIGGQLGTIVLLVDLWIVSAVVSAGVAISDFAIGTTFGQTITHVASLGRSTGLTTHSNHLAFVMALTAPLAIGRLAVARTWTMRIVFGGALAAVMMAVMASGSRGGLVGAALAVSVTPFLMPHGLRKRTFSWIALAGAAAVLAGSFVFADDALVALDRLTGKTTEVASVSESDFIRAELRRQSIENFSNNPIAGSGLAHSRDAHNIFLQLLASTGVIGTLAFIAFLLGYFDLSRQLSRRRSLPTEVRVIAATAGVSAITWGALGMVENQLADRYLFVPCGFVIACAWFTLAPGSGEARC